MHDSTNKLKLHGFNNLTKTLSFNIYDISWAETAGQQHAYIDSVDEAYDCQRLTRILVEVCDIIGATVLNIASQDYDPQGSSVTLLIAEEPMLDHARVAAPRSVVGHLDKSHVTVHTYPESHPDQGVSTFRADIEVSTCGVISPLKALNHLIGSFDSDIVIMDYRVRGFTRDVRGHKHFIDHDIQSIRNFISPETRDRYQMIDANLFEQNIFHTKMMLKDFRLEDYLFKRDLRELSAACRRTITERLRHEMQEIYYGRNMPEPHVC